MTDTNIDQLTYSQIRHLVDSLVLQAHLLGEVMATFQIPENREFLKREVAGETLLDIADSWIERYERIKAREGS